MINYETGIEFIYKSGFMVIRCKDKLICHDTGAEWVEEIPPGAAAAAILKLIEAVSMTEHESPESAG